VRLCRTFSAFGIGGGVTQGVALGFLGADLWSFEWVQPH
jgi:hypothetical protein